MRRYIACFSILPKSIVFAPVSALKQGIFRVNDIVLIFVRTASGAAELRWAMPAELPGFGKIKTDMQRRYHMPAKNQMRKVSFSNTDGQILSNMTSELL